METIGERIRLRREQLGLSQEELAKALGYKSRSSINKIELGLQKLTQSKISSTAEALQTTPYYIMGWDDAVSRAFNVVPVGKQGMRPIYGSVSAGLGEYVEGDNEILGWETVEEKYATDEFFYLRVKGDSMSPKIEDGDLLLIRKQTSVDSGDIGAFLVDGEEGYVKRVKYDTDYVTLISLNPAYEPIYFVGEQVKRVRVVGKIIEVKRKL